MIGHERHGPEPQGEVDCTKCEHYETDLTEDPCWKCLVCEIRCGFKEKNNDGSGEDEGSDCPGCQTDL